MIPTCSIGSGRSLRRAWRIMNATLFGILFMTAARAELSIVATTPIVADLAERVGGTNVQVTCLLQSGSLDHDFALTPEQAGAVSHARLILASGKGLETSCLDEVRRGMGKEGQLLEVGRKVPSVQVDAGNSLFVCCPNHAGSTVDPMWWHSVKGMKRAVRVVAKAMAKLDPAHAAAYSVRGDAYREELDDLDDWIKAQVESIPASRRSLATTQNAYAYFGRDYGFKLVPVGTVSDREDSVLEVSDEVLETLRTYKIPVVFSDPAHGVPSNLSEADVKVGPFLLSNAFTTEAPTYIQLMQHNVTTIVETLRP